MRAANFVEETTTSIAGTGGNGAVTLTAVTGRPRFSTVFGTQATMVRYVIEDTTNGKFETGIGEVATNVLTRTKPHVTWDGTTYDDTNPSPLAFGSTPASGNIRVRLSATAEERGVVVSGRNNTVGGSSGWRDYPVSAAFSARGNGSNGDGLVAGREYYSAYKLEMAGLLTGIQIGCITAAAGAQVKAALYDCDRTGLPGRKIVDFNTFDLSTTGDKVDTATATWSTGGPVWLVPGWYFVGLQSNNVSAVITADFANGNLMVATPLGRVNGYGYTNVVHVAGNFSSGLPSLPNLSGGTLADPGGTRLSFIWIGLRVEA